VTHGAGVEDVGARCEYEFGNRSTAPYDSQTGKRRPERTDWWEDCPHVPDFLTDWSTTGPLVEKLSISLDCRFGAGMPIAERWQAVAWRPDDNPKTVWKADGSTPLVNVCRLIVSLSAAGKLSR